MSYADDAARRAPAPLFSKKQWHVLRITLPMRAFCLLAFALAALPSQGGEHHHHPPEDAALHHRFYVTWNIPNDGKPRKQSCCNRQDCYPTQIKNVGGTYFALRRENQVWVPVPDSKIEHNQSDPREFPDGRNHVCMAPPQDGIKVYCAVLGSGG